MVTITKHRFEEIASGFKGKMVLVIGDLMLDEYLLGKVDRISPEAPVPVVNIHQEYYRLGGAANVALNIQSLGCESILAGVTGADQHAEIILNRLQENKISTTCIMNTNDRPTTVKTRVIGHSQHMIRFDRESVQYMSEKEQDVLLDKIKSIIPEVSAMIFQDYNKGVLSPHIIKELTRLMVDSKIPIFVDPKFNNFGLYKNAFFFKPNIKETEAALAVTLDSEYKINQAGNDLLKSHQAENVLITRGSKGMTLFEKNGEITHVQSKVRSVADVSGAGDTVISALTAASIGGATPKEAAAIANSAAGIVCGEVGIVPIKLKDLSDSYE